MLINNSWCETPACGFVVRYVTQAQLDDLFEEYSGDYSYEFLDLDCFKAAVAELINTRSTHIGLVNQPCPRCGKQNWRHLEVQELSLATEQIHTGPKTSNLG